MAELRRRERLTELLRIPFDQPFLRTLAAELLERESDGLPRATVLLPSTRAVRTLRHELLDASGREALLLPEIVTPGLLIRDLAARLGFDRQPFPAALRSEWLARRLVVLPWLENAQESAPGLAVEFVSLFDEMRRHDLDPADPATSGTADLLMDDVDHVRDAWALYRPLIPWDDVDAEMSVTQAVETGSSWPGRPLASLWIAGFVDLPPLRARLLRAAANRSTQTILALSDTADAGAASDFLSTFSDEDSPLHPASPPRTVVTELALDIAANSTSTPQEQRSGTLSLISCSDPEHESRRIAALVVEHLDREPDLSIGIATSDQSLARRVVAQLRDTGLDLDDSGGVPLSTTPSGRLVWLLVRCAVTGPAHEPLLELLTHPLATFGRDIGRHKGRTRSFEQDLLRGRTAPGSLAGYRVRAEERDAALSRAIPGADPEMTELVDDLDLALEPLFSVAEGSHGLTDILSALESAWNRAAPEHPLPAVDDAGADAEPRALAQLLDAMAKAAASAPEMTLVEAASMLTRLLGAETVRPHRAENLPVQVTGLLEARLETFDLLVLGGMTEDRVPGRVGRPLYLGRAWRESAGLPDWRRTVGQQAELFARLLHAGRDVVLTWPGDVDGQPTLPSPFLQRLMLAGRGLTEFAGPPLLYRRTPDPEAPTTAPATRIGDEAPSVEAPTRPIRSISPSALTTYRNCPYRWLMEKGFGLGEEDDIKEALESRDQGTIVHDCMASFLDPVGPGIAALVAGRLDEAKALLVRIADERFTHHAGELPQRRIWEASFLAGADALLEFEHRRLALWRPAAVEASFDIPLGEVADWLGHDCGLEDDERAIPLHGRIDRIDAARDGSPHCAVIDYKTGTPPTNKDVAEGKDLQLAAYALAVILGGLPGLPDQPVIAGGAYYALRNDDPGFKQLLPLDQLQRDAETIVVTARAMIRAEGTFPLVPDSRAIREPVPCRFCHLRGVCRLDERDLSHREVVIL